MGNRPKWGGALQFRSLPNCNVSRSDLLLTDLISSQKADYGDLNNRSSDHGGDITQCLGIYFSIVVQ